MRGTSRWALLLALLLALGLAVAACGGDDEEGGDDGAAAESTPAEDEGGGEPIVIGAAVDLTNQMAPFDGPAITAAQIQVDKINEAGGIDGRQVELEVIDHQLDPERTKSAAIELIDGGADVLLVTCDVDYATPAVQEAITRGVLAVAPCIGTDQMGPERFGDAGKLAFSIGNVAQDEGAAMAEYAIEQGWMTAATVTDNVIVYFQDVVKAFASPLHGAGRRDHRRGVLDERRRDDPERRQRARQGERRRDRHLDGLRRHARAGGRPPHARQRDADHLRLVVRRQLLAPRGDEQLLPRDVRVGVRRRPERRGEGAHRRDEEQDPAPGTGGFVTGAAAIDAIAAAIEETGGTEGEALAEAFEGFDGLETISGAISFSPEFHSVFGREYRVMEVQNSQPAFVELRAATSPAEIE